MNDKYQGTALYQKIERFLCDNPKYFIMGLIGLHLTLTFFFTIHGHFVDSPYYHMETLALIEHGGFNIQNGYAHHPVTAKLNLLQPGVNGYLYSQYPTLYPMLAVPFVKLFGISGYFIINSLSFIGVLFFIVKIIRLFSNDSMLAILSCTILTVSSHFWHYSQAIWPHMFQIFMITGAAYFAMIGKDDKRTHSWYFVYAGIMVGFAIGSRLDSLFVIPAIGILCWFHRNPIRSSILFGFGLLPEIAVLAYTHYMKYGSYMFLSYQHGMGADNDISFDPDKPIANGNPVHYIPLLTFLTLTHLLFFVRYAKVNILEMQPKLRTALTVVLSVTALSLFLLFFGKTFEGILGILVDMSFLGFSSNLVLHLDVTNTNNPLYMEHYKKAFFQSFPFFFIALLPLLSKRYHFQVPPWLVYWLGLIPLNFFYIYTTLSWHGGMALDMRYELPALPFLSVLAALALTPLFKALPIKSNHLFSVVGISFTLLVIMLLSIIADPNSLIRKFIFLYFPYVIALFFVILLLRFSKFPEKIADKWQGSKTTLLLIFLAFPGISSLIDYTLINVLRGISNSRAYLSEFIEPDSYLISEYYLMGTLGHIKGAKLNRIKSKKPHLEPDYIPPKKGEEEPKQYIDQSFQEGVRKLLVHAHEESIKVFYFAPDEDYHEVFMEALDTQFSSGDFIPKLELLNTKEIDTKTSDEDPTIERIFRITLEPQGVSQ